MKIEAINDDAIHQFIIETDKMIIQGNWRNHFDSVGPASKHGYLIIEKGELVSEGTNFPEDEFKSFHGQIVII